MTNLIYVPVLIATFFTFPGDTPVSIQVSDAPLEQVAQVFEAPVTAALSLVSSELEIGDTLEIDLALTNNLDHPIVLARSLDASDVGWRSPRIDIEVFGPDGELIVEDGFGRCGMVNPLNMENDLVPVAAGDSFDPFGDGAFGHQFLYFWRPEEPGTYTVQVVYDTTSADAFDWRGGGDLSNPLWQQLYHGRVVSNLASFTVR